MAVIEATRTGVSENYQDSHYVAFLLLPFLMDEEIGIDTILVRRLEFHASFFGYAHLSKASSVARGQITSKWFLQKKGKDKIGI